MSLLSGSTSSSSVKTLLLLALVATHGLSGASAKGGKGFLRQSSAEANDHLSVLKTSLVDQEVGEALTEALGHGHGLSPAQLEAKEARLRPMFDTMPKNMFGRTGRDAMHYMVTRHFGAEHGWSIKGFQPSDGVASAERSQGGAKASHGVLKQKLPGYIESVLEQRLDHEGFALADVVTMTVVLERLIFDEGLAMLEDSYYLMQKETDQRLNQTALTDVVVVYMMLYAFEADRRNRTDLRYTIGKISQDYPKGWPAGKFGVAEMRSELAEIRAENPFADFSAGYSFEVAHRATARATENYARWNSEEQCNDLKGALANLDRDRTGRVRLADFYSVKNVSGNWFLEETQDYLRQAGALDESSPSKGPQVIIPNYVQAPANCMEVSSFYHMCCQKECDGLLGRIETEIRTPMATPARILPVVQQLIDEREEAPRNLTAMLRSQLESIAEHHGVGGQVPLHGRLFSQWLHYAFPRECPYPQTSAQAANWSKLDSSYNKETGQARFLTLAEMDAYVKKHGGSAKGSEEEDEDFEGEGQCKMWTMEEELYVGYHHQVRQEATARRSGAWAGFLSNLACLGILASGFLALKPLLTKTWREFSMEEVGRPKHKGHGNGFFAGDANSVLV